MMWESRSRAREKEDVHMSKTLLWRSVCLSNVRYLWLSMTDLSRSILPRDDWNVMVLQTLRFYNQEFRILCQEIRVYISNENDEIKVKRTWCSAILITAFHDIIIFWCRKENCIILHWIVSDVFLNFKKRHWSLFFLHWISSENRKD